MRKLPILAVALALVLASGASAATLPDLFPVAQMTWSSYYTTTETFDPNGCAVQEGSITAGTHRLLRFSTEVANIGADFDLGSGHRNDPNWEYGACHHHWHWVGFASYLLLDSTGQVVGTGHKQGFCVEDYMRYWADALTYNRMYDCQHQGIHPGWADVYTREIVGQWVVIDGLPSGGYTLRITINWNYAIPESDFANNTIDVFVSI